MTETEARDRIRAAVGEADYPGGLSASLVAHLVASGRGKHGTVWLQTLVAGVLVLLVLAAMVLPRVMRDYSAWTSLGRTAPVARPSAPLPSPPATPPLAQVPVADLQAAGLAGTPGAVTSFNEPATDGAYTLTLIGLYADKTRTIFFFHIDPDPGFAPGSLRIADQQGELNASAIGNRGVPGDYVYQLNAGPRAGVDGYAQLTIRVLALTPLGLPKRADGNWVFMARVRVGPAV